MNRGKINPGKIQEHALEQGYSTGKEAELYYSTISLIKEAIDDIDRAGKKITYLRIAQRLQLNFKGITPTELYNEYNLEITAYTEQYDT
ncbi:MAG: hypothetical protein KAH32_05095 [Chlamydiia bacterium]|nr:hypothetical protein [Chlamydiia bacterium]